MVMNGVIPASTLEALNKAAAGGSTRQIGWILKNNPGILENNARPLHWALQNDNRKNIHFLLDNGADVNGDVNGDGCMIHLEWELWEFRKCAGSGSAPRPRKDIIKLLLDRGADPNEGLKCLRYMRKKEVLVDILRMLVDAGADVNMFHGSTVALHWVAAGTYPGALQILLDAGALVDMRSGNGYVVCNVTPLHWAVNNRRHDNMMALLHAGANPNAADDAGRTALHKATGAESPSFEMVNALLTAGSDPLHRDNNDETPLSYLHPTYAYDNDEDYHKIITALVAAGDRAWACVPTPCPGIAAALTKVWKAAPTEVREIVKRMENPPQNVAELFPRLDDEMQEVVQVILKGVHCLSPDFTQQLFLNLFF